MPRAAFSKIRSPRLARRSPRSTCRSPAACLPSYADVTCATGPTRWGWTTPPTTGSWARAWFTVCGCATAGPSGTATGGSAPGCWPSRWARNGRPGRSTPTSISPPTPTSSLMPAAPWPPWRPARCPMSCPVSWTPSARATSARTPSPTGGTGDLHAIAYYFAWEHVQHVVINPAGRVSRTTDIPVADGPMMHDFALTGKYVVLFDLPVTFSMDAVSAGQQMPYTWNPAHQARVGLLPRDGSPGDVRWLEVDPCWIFHTLNAYDDGDRVVADLIRYEGAYDVATLGGHGPVTLDRWIIDPAAGKVTQQRLDDRIQEFPRVDDRVIAQPHRYGYSAVIGEVSQATVSLSGDFTDQAFANALLKHDLAAGTVQAHEFGRGATAGEAVFAPAAPDAAEDHGYVMAFVHDPDRGAADLVILAAQDFTGEPVARVHLPARIPLGFHGSWIADQ